MSFKISYLHLEGNIFSNYVSSDSENALSNLSKINIFVGPNNSGKSRFLREICKISRMRFALAEDLSRYDELVKKLKNKIVQVIRERGDLDVNAFISKVGSLPSLESITEGEKFLQPFGDLLSEMREADRHMSIQHNQHHSTTGDFDQYKGVFPSIAEEVRQELIKIFGNKDETINFKRVYIPTLRSLRYVTDKDLLRESVISRYFKESSNVEVFTGQELYSELQKLLLGSLEERKSVARFQDFLSEAFFEGKPVALIPKFGERELVVKIGDETERAIYELGDGIQSIIILTFPIFQHHDENMLLFIEEPELFLHPGMQRIFLNSLFRPEFQNAQCFIATHSNHILDLTLDIEQMSVFALNKVLEEGDSIEKESKVTVENVSNQVERSLPLLGIRNSSVFLSNCTIWVEGITDRRYFSHYLNLYQDELERQASSEKGYNARRYKQDLHYSFVEYAGSNITHFSFLDAEVDPIVVERLCAKLYLITDKDSVTNVSKSERHKSLAAMLPNRYYCLNCREVENLLTPQVIISIVKSYEGEEVTLNEFSASDYQSIGLGEFIESKVIKPPRNRKASYQVQSGTISDKITFCQKALEVIKTFNDLSEEAKHITKLLYKFVDSRNT